MAPSRRGIGEHILYSIVHGSTVVGCRNARVQRAGDGDSGRVHARSVGAGRTRRARDFGTRAHAAARQHQACSNGLWDSISERGCALEEDARRAEKTARWPITAVARRRHCVRGRLSPDAASLRPRAPDVRGARNSHWARLVRLSSSLARAAALVRAPWRLSSPRPRRSTCRHSASPCPSSRRKVMGATRSPVAGSTSPFRSSATDDASHAVELRNIPSRTSCTRSRRAHLRGRRGPTSSPTRSTSQPRRDSPRMRPSSRRRTTRSPPKTPRSTRRPPGCTSSATACSGQTAARVLSPFQSSAASRLRR